jgi:hypothetical protein
MLRDPGQEAVLDEAPPDSWRDARAGGVDDLIMIGFFLHSVVQLCSAAVLEMRHVFM